MPTLSRVARQPVFRSRLARGKRAWPRLPSREAICQPGTSAIVGDRWTVRETTHQKMRNNSLTVAQAAVELALTPRRVRALITAGRIKAKRVNPRLWLIDRQDLEVVRVRKNGRPTRAQSS